MLTQLPLLTDTECEETVTKLQSLRDHWLDRSTDRMATFFTLGRASYLDVCLTGKDQELNYYQAVRKSNELLLSHFSDLYSRLLESLYSELADPVTYTDKLARPGFHVFLGSAISAAGQARAHFDVQYDKLQFGGKPDSV